MTTITAEDLQRLGEIVLRSAAVMVALGHGSPRGLVDYVLPDQADPMAMLAHNLFVSCIFGSEGTAAADAVRRVVEEYGLLDVIAESAALDG